MQGSGQTSPLQSDIPFIFLHPNLSLVILLQKLCIAFITIQNHLIFSFVYMVIHENVSPSSVLLFAHRRAHKYFWVIE